MRGRDTEEFVLSNKIFARRGRIAKALSQKEQMCILVKLTRKNEEDTSFLRLCFFYTINARLPICQFFLT